MTAEAIVIIGADGDLAQRMLFPSLYFLDSEKCSPPENFRIVGASRSDHTNEAFVDQVKASVQERAATISTKRPGPFQPPPVLLRGRRRPSPPTFQHLPRRSRAPTR